MQQTDYRLALLGAVAVMVPSVAVYVKALLSLQTAILTKRLDEINANQAKPETVDGLRIEVAQVHTMLINLEHRIERLEDAPKSETATPDNTGTATL